VNRAPRTTGNRSADQRPAPGSAAKSAHERLPRSRRSEQGPSDHGHGHHQTGPQPCPGQLQPRLCHRHRAEPGLRRIIEAFYGWKIDSLALLADAGHNLSDVIRAGAGLGRALAGRLRPDARHTYGWKRATILAAFANAFLLLMAMGALVWEAVGRLLSPAPLAAAQGITIMVVASIGIGINTATALLFMRGGSKDLNIRGAFLHMAADALVSAGVVVAGALTLWMGWAWLDPVVSLAIAAVILIGTWSLFRQSLHLLFDGVPDHVDPVAVRAVLAALPGVTRVLRPAYLGDGHLACRADRPPGDAPGAARRCVSERRHRPAA
jgi:cation diffusion facilitator family transporter